MTFKTPQTLDEALGMGMVPSARVAPILRRGLIAEFGEEFQAEGACGSLARRLYRWEEETEYVGFDSVDDAFCALHLDVHRIWTEELADLYYGITFKEVPSPAFRSRSAQAVS